MATCRIHAMVNIDIIGTDEERMDPCPHEATHLHCAMTNLVVCEKHKCRCDLRISALSSHDVRRLGSAR